MANAEGKHIPLFPNGTVILPSRRIVLVVVGAPEVLVVVLDVVACGYVGLQGLVISTEALNEYGTAWRRDSHAVG